MKNKLVPNINECLGKAIEKLVELKPETLPHLNWGKGRWSHLITGWKAQGDLVAKRFTDEAIATRLISSGSALQELVASEFDVAVDLDPTFAIGEVSLGRVDGSLPAGVIRKGHPFFKQGDPDAQPLPVANARYEVTQDVLVVQGQTIVNVPIRALQSGPSANMPAVVAGVEDPEFPDVATSQLIKAASPLFDPNLSTNTCRAAGGSSNPVNDRNLRNIARAFSQGKFGPTLGAVKAGALSSFGVANLAIHENLNTAKTVIFATDESWAYSDALSAAVGQHIKDGFSGFGCSILMGRTVNEFVQITATVQLTDSKYLIDTTQIEADIKTALTSYFNDRPDWYIWTDNGIKDTIAGANRKIFACTSLVVKDQVFGDTLSEPSSFTVQDSDPRVTHWYFQDNAAVFTFIGPS